MKTIKLFLNFIVMMTIATSLFGCWYVAAAGAGAYGGYKAKEEGYTLQSPIKKESTQKKTEKKKQDSKEEVKH